MKNLGISLIFVGIAIILLVMFFAFQIFVQEEEPPMVFKEREVMISDVFGGIPVATENGEEMEIAIGEGVKIEDVFPINKTLNLSAFSIFAFIIFSGAVKLTKIGIEIKRDN
ncbi:MAG: hypothetical protein K9M12_00375 [Candidatus Pacebacteria bacterium]|nr:hypothetical protein [Candidatus Paceibacterota bacterium]